jgi:hypothetical protein
MKTEEVIKYIGKTQYQVVREVYGGFKTEISFTTYDAAQIYVGNKEDKPNRYYIIESIIKEIISL